MTDLVYFFRIHCIMYLLDTTEELGNDCERWFVLWLEDGGVA